MQLADQMAVTLLACSDAIFLPDRFPLLSPRHQVLYERRRAYPNAGVPWASEKVASALDDAGRKEVQRVLEELVVVFRESRLA